MKMNHEWTRRDTKTDGPPTPTSGTKIRLQFRALGGTLCPWWITPSIGFRQVEGSGSRTARCDVVKLVSVIDGLAEINGHGGENIRADQFTVHSSLSTIYYLLTTSHIAVPPPYTTGRLIPGESGVFQARGLPFEALLRPGANAIFGQKVRWVCKGFVPGPRL